MQQTTQYINGIDLCHLSLVKFEDHDNHICHQTRGLSKKYLVVRRGKPFKVTLLFHRQPWNPRTESLALEVKIGSLSERMQVQLSDKRANTKGWWSAIVYPGDLRAQSVTIHICSPPLASVASYLLLIHIENNWHRRSYTAGAFVLLCNPWLEDDPVYMPVGAHIDEYVKSDYGLVFMGTHLRVNSRPWSFGQYEPGVLETCLKLLQVSPQHLNNKNKDYMLRGDPVYLSRVVCAMVNCNDDLGVLEGKWQGSYKDGTRPTEWNSSAEILKCWASNNCSPVRYGQCWVFASVLCTVMRVLGIPARVVTVFNAAHDGDGNLAIEEYYSSRGEKLNVSKDSYWNFHVWVECWMRRPDLGEGFDGWQVVDPTPQEKSAGVFCCGPCPVVAVQQHRLGAPYDTSFIYASVDADIVRLVVHDGLVVGRTVDKESMGQLIYTKRINSDAAENLTRSYKTKKEQCTPVNSEVWCTARSVESYGAAAMGGFTTPQSSEKTADRTSSSLEVSLTIEGVPLLGKSICMCVTVTNKSSRSRVFREHLNAQLKEYNSSPQDSFWRVHKEVHIRPQEVLSLRHAIAPSDYELLLKAEDIVKMAVVVKDMKTKERILATQDISISSPQINIELEGGDSIQMRIDHTALVSFTNSLAKDLSGAVLIVEGAGLVSGKQESRMVLLKAGGKIEKKVNIKATSLGTKVLMATFSYGKSPGVIARSFHKVCVVN